MSILNDLKGITIIKLNNISMKQIESFEISINSTGRAHNLTVLFKDGSKKQTKIYLVSNSPTEYLRKAYDTIKNLLLEDLPYMDRKIRELAIT